MNWFGGCAPGGRSVVPAGARFIWDDPPLWTVGAGSQRFVRTLTDRDGRLAVFGPCSATDGELSRALSSPDLAAFGGAWAGTYSLVRAGSDGILEVISDAAGACPVYTARVPGGVVWGSSSRALAGLTGGRVDTEWLSAYLLDVQGEMPQRSAWVGVELVPAGHQLRLRDGRVERLSPWWTIRRKAYKEAVASLGDALVGGVRARVAGVPVSSDVAGLDSSTLAVLAALEGPVTGMTVHPDGAADGGDVTYARALARALSVMRHVLFPLDERHLPLSEAETELPATDEPAPSSITWARCSAQLRAVSRAGAVCHMTGDGGDTLFQPPPTHLSDLARSGQWGRLVADAQAWALLRRVSPWGLVRAAVRRDGFALVGGGGQRPAWLTAAAPDRLSLPAVENASDAALLAEVRYVARSARTEQQLADSLGVELHNPYLDGRVVDAVMSAAPRERCSVSRYKPLLADAVGPLLPQPVRRRRTKGVFVGEFHRGMRANLRRVLDLTEGRLAGLGLVTPEPLRAAVHAAALGAETAWPALLPTLNAEMWLAAVDRAPAIEWHDRRGGSSDR
ncbi:albusnodin/ikarugamycin family macrolactam cyclase [Streptomyces yunnanensis]|uniref:asparagine synthase (glutamine-hydrolyzing) n=1 Tax=Streptomyces yunnanensis TaxID=156453 RepID=A0ABY8A956_9ACTN|nr:albusnodin/ikarugamycin family macrolactam cyclase [Streptomyces yunnanensis]WEB41498.1 albusnodin/ikarugamycin family macrolactam cyclase [Streptomyces yunnanensis]